MEVVDNQHRFSAYIRSSNGFKISITKVDSDNRKPLDDLQITCTKGMYPHLPTEWRHPLEFDVGNNLKGGLDPSRYKECDVSMFAI